MQSDCRKRNATHLTTGKKSKRYCDECLLSSLNAITSDKDFITTGAEKNQAETVVHLSSSYTQMYGHISKRDCSTQVAVARRNQSTCTGTPLTCAKHNYTQMRNTCFPSNETHGQKLLGKMPMWNDFAKVIEEANQTDRFCKLVESLANGNLPCTNLVWKSCLDMGTLSICASTTTMRYDKDCVEFFSLFHLMFGSSAINVLRGTGHFGSLVNKTSNKGKYKPSEGNFNFAIPSITTLKKVGCGYPTDIQVGFVEQSLDIAQEQAATGSQFVLGFDGKMVAQGCKNECDGDVNLWGREKPCLQSTVISLTKKLKCAVDIDV